MCNRQITDNSDYNIALNDFNATLVNLSRQTKDFLIIAGLPESAPPFLSFVPSVKGGGVRLTEKYEIDGSFSNHLYFGFTETSDPICIVEGFGKIVYIDLEKNFKEVFINSTIPQFLEEAGT